MKFFIIILLSLSLSYGFEYNLKPQKVAEDVYCFFGKLENINKQNAGNMVNTCFVQTKEGYVVIDSGPTYIYAAQAYMQMQKIAKLPVKYVINTHDHDDHWLGNSFYKNKGALLIGPQTYEENTFPTMKTRMQRLLGEKLFNKTKIVKLDTIIDTNLTLAVGNDVFKISQPVAMAHTKGDLIIYFPRNKVIFTGDLLFNGRLTSLRDGSIVGSLKALDIIESYDADFIVSGHGYDTSKNATKQFMSYLSEMKEKVQDALNNDVGMDEIIKKVPMLKYKNMKLYDVLHGRNVLDAYKELELMEDEEE